MVNKYVHLRTFPFSYEISTEGVCRQRIRNGFRRFSRIDEPDGSFVWIEVRGKLQKCLLAELVLISFHPAYVPGDEIRYRDGNIHNVKFDNLKTRKQRAILNYNSDNKYDRWKTIWRCQSRAENANVRSGPNGMMVDADQVLRCLLVTDFKCFYCLNGLNPHKWHLDHYFPISKGGRNEFENLRASCKYCNIMKSDLEYEQWISKIHRVLTVYTHDNPDRPFADIEINKGSAKIAQPDQLTETDQKAIV